MVQKGAKYKEVKMKRVETWQGLVWWWSNLFGDQ